MKLPPDPRPTIIEDTREQAPVSGHFRQYPFIREALPVGDYGLVGFSDWSNPAFVVERKSMDDLVQSLTHDRERFMREIQKLRNFRFAAICVEASKDEIEMRCYRSQANPTAILASVDAIIVRAGIHVFWCGSPPAVAAQIESLVRQFCRGLRNDFITLMRASANVGES